MPTASPARGSSTSGMAVWLGTAAAAAFVATAVDALLLHKRRSYFTGGFLAVDHIASPAQAAAFFTGSLVADFAVVSVGVVAALWLCRWIGLGSRVSASLAAACGLAPILASDFVAYRLQSFLGDAFDFALMFQLAGRSPAEILAVSSSQVVGVVAGLGAILLALVSAAWWLRRRTTPAGAFTAPTTREAVLVAAVILFVGAGSTAALRSASDTLDNGLRRKPSGQLLGWLVTWCSDLDRDGYGLLGRLRDPALFDARIHPYAVDVPGNGIDEDGVAGDLPATLPPYVESGPPGRWMSTPTVVLVALESFRADAFGASVRGHAVTPVLNALAQRGVSSAFAYSHNGYTVQSRQHVFTGSVAGLRGPTTLVDDFASNGYETAYFSGQDESFGGPSTDVGFSRAATSYDARADVNRRYSTFSTAGSLAVPYSVVLERVGAFLRKRTSDRPLFLYVNFHDTHFPYHHAGVRQLLPTPSLTPSDIVPDRAVDLRAMYLNTAANVDDAIGQLLQMVRAAVGAEPGVIVLSDHGESLFDEGFLGHGYALNDAQTRIPLVAAGLPLALVEPLGQADLRDAIASALSGAPSATGPSVRRDPGRRVFQYLGAIDSPAQIALTGLSGRTVYDFRSERARIDGDAWRPLADLTGEGAQRARELVQLWESMMLARERHAN